VRDIYDGYGDDPQIASQVTRTRQERREHLEDILKDAVPAAF
jgi:hypothetical protein